MVRTIMVRAKTKENAIKNFKLNYPHRKFKRIAYTFSIYTRLGRSRTSVKSDYNKYIIEYN